MKRTGTQLIPCLRNYLLTLDNNTIYAALANQGHGKTENAYWKGITAMRAEPDHRWNPMWLEMWKHVPAEVDKLPPAAPPTQEMDPELQEALKDPDVQASVKRFLSRSKERRQILAIQEEVEKRVKYLLTFSSFPEKNIRDAIYACLYIHCPFRLPTENRLQKLIQEGYGEAFLALAKKLNEWQPLPLEFS